MGLTNVTITGSGIQLNSQFGNVSGNQSLAFVQWQVGYEPINHPWQEWISNPVSVNWAGTYTASNKKWEGFFSTDFDGPIYMWTQLSEDNSQVGLWKISDILPSSGGTLNINLNNTNIMSVVGESASNTLITRTLETWTPTAVPEPSYSSLAGFLFLCVVLYKKYV
jgi:hypothetical protein